MPSASPAPFKVLLIEDSTSMRELVAAVLEPFGMTVRESDDAESGLREAATWQPDVILLDLLLPGMNGLDACRRLRASRRTRDIPVLLVSAMDDQGSAIAAVEAGVDGVIRKPINPVDLPLRVQSLARLSWYRRSLLELEQVDDEAEAPSVV